MCQLFSIALLVALTKTFVKMDRILTEVRFCFHKGVFRETADLLDCMLHRVLSIASVKIVRFQNAIPHRLRGELTCGSFQLYIW